MRRDWLLHVGVVCIMDNLIEHLKFTIRFSQIRYAAFVVGEEFGHVGLKADIDSGAYDPEASDSRSKHTTSLNDAFLTFSMMDYAAILGLGPLDMAVIRHLCVLDDAGEPAYDALIRAAGGGNIGAGGHGPTPKAWWTWTNTRLVPIIHYRFSS